MKKERENKGQEEEEEEEILAWGRIDNTKEKRKRQRGGDQKLEGFNLGKRKRRKVYVVGNTQKGTSKISALEFLSRPS